MRPSASRVALGPIPSNLQRLDGRQVPEFGSQSSAGDGRHRTREATTGHDEDAARPGAGIRSPSPEQVVGRMPDRSEPDAVVELVTGSQISVDQQVGDEGPEGPVPCRRVIRTRPSAKERCRMRFARPSMSEPAPQYTRRCRLERGRPRARARLGGKARVRAGVQRHARDTTMRAGCDAMNAPPRPPRRAGDDDEDRATSGRSVGAHPR